MNMNVKSLHLTVSVICERSKKCNEAGDNSEFLMVEELPSNHTSSVINQPAGHVEANETLIDAVIRETLEETGYDLNPNRIVGIYQFTTEQGKTYFRICFCGSVKRPPQPTNIDKDIIAVHWMSAVDILSHQNHRSPLVAQCLQDYLDGKRYPLDILCTLNKPHLN